MDFFGWDYSRTAATAAGTEDEATGVSKAGVSVAGVKVPGSLAVIVARGHRSAKPRSLSLVGRIKWLFHAANEGLHFLL